MACSNCFGCGKCSSSRSYSNKTNSGSGNYSGKDDYASGIPNGHIGNYSDTRKQY